VDYTPPTSRDDQPVAIGVTRTDKKEKSPFLSSVFYLFFIFMRI
jgi:hypothetical protein